VGLLKENDTLLIIGKGNEEYMEIQNNKVPFSDKKIIYKYLNIDY
jgi:UDP-N-acetylmuramyl tripeptide synthase